MFMTLFTITVLKSFAIALTTFVDYAHLMIRVMVWRTRLGPP